MAKFRKLPGEVEALPTSEVVQLAIAGELPAWLAEAVTRNDVVIGRDTISIKTAQGTQLAGPDDFVVQENTGAISACSSAVFSGTYEAVAAPVRAAKGKSKSLAPAKSPAKTAVKAKEQSKPSAKPRAKKRV